MKKIMTILAIAFVTMTNAQTTPETTNTTTTLSVSTETTTVAPQAIEGFTEGDCFITGGFAFSANENNGSQDARPLNVNIKYGHFVTNNIALGLDAGIVTTDTEATSRRANNYSLGIFGRYYITPADKFSVFGELGLNTQFYNGQTFGDDSNNYNRWSAVLSPGVSYTISNHFKLETSVGLLGYSHTEGHLNDAGDYTDSKGLDLNFNLSNLNLGLVYKF